MCAQHVRPRWTSFSPGKKFAYRRVLAGPAAVAVATLVEGENPEIILEMLDDRIPICRWSPHRVQQDDRRIAGCAGVDVREGADTEGRSSSHPELGQSGDVAGRHSGFEVSARLFVSFGEDLRHLVDMSDNVATIERDQQLEIFRLRRQRLVDE